MDRYSCSTLTCWFSPGKDPYQPSLVAPSAGSFLTSEQQQMQDAQTLDPPSMGLFFFFFCPSSLFLHFWRRVLTNPWWQCSLRDAPPSPQWLVDRNPHLVHFKGPRSIPILILEAIPIKLPSEKKRDAPSKFQPMRLRLSKPMGSHFGRFR